MHASVVLKQHSLAMSCTHQAEAHVVVAVVGCVVVAIRRPTVDGVVVPTAAAYYAIRA